MKKITIILFVFFSIYLYTGITNDMEEIVIPNSSIRMRVVANSDEVRDQIEKYDLVNNIIDIISDIEKESNNIEESRLNIEKAIPEIELIITALNLEADINFGYNYFPDKTYKKITYNSGDYESLVITIGEGKGENWWCILFPPLCLLEVEEEINDLDYTFYVKDIINKYF